METIERPCILIVDDDPGKLLSIESILLDLDADMVKAGSGSEALKLLLHMDFAVIILDVHMPDMSGFEAAYHIRSREKSKHIPVIFVTAALFDDIYKLQGYSLGAVDYISVPLIPEILKAKVAFFIDLYSKTREIRLKKESLEKANAELEEEIENHRKTQAMLKESEMKYRLLFEQAPVGISIETLEGGLVDANRSMLDMLGFSIDELRGTGLLGVYERKADMGSMRELLMQKGNVRSFITKMKRQDGTVFDAMLNLNWVLGNDGPLVRTTCMDITEQIKAEEEIKNFNRMLEQLVEERTAELAETNRSLKASEEKYKSLVENINVGIALIDGDLQVHSLNNQMKEWFPQAGQEGRPATHCYELLFNYRNTCPECISGQCITDGSVYENIKEIPVGNGRRTFRISVSPIRDHGDFGRQAILMLDDITDRISLERQLFQSQKMESIGTLAGGIAHDFNNMLTAININSELALIDHSDEKQLVSCLSEILDAGNRAAMLTRQILLFSRKQVLEPVNVDIKSIISNFEKLMRRIIGENIELVIRHNVESGIVNADVSQIEQVLMNLCVNARDAMAEGGKIVVETESVVLDRQFCSRNLWAKPGEYVRIAVSDTGCGIDDETMAHIFEPFYTTKEQGKGTGLGLAVVFGIIKQHDGLIDVSSRPERGTEFFIYLRRAVPEIEKKASRDAEGVQGGSETVLIVEDDKSVRQTLFHLIKAYGYDVITASEGSEAMKIIEEKGSGIGLVLTDVMMPGMDGWRLYENARSRKPSLKFLFLSGYSTDDFVVENRLDFVQKPFEFRELLKRVRSILDREGSAVVA